MAGTGVDSSEVKAQAQAAIEAWKRDGTAVAEPVTTSTPVIQAAIFADKPVPTPSEVAAQVDGLEPAVAPPVEPVVDTTPAEEEVKWFVGRDAEGKDFKVPETFQIPVTVDGEVSWVTIGEAQQGNMRQADYTRKTMTAAEARRAGEQAQREYALNLKKLEAQRELIQSEREELLSAAADPEEFERLVKRMEDPDYKRLYKEAQEGRRLQAEAIIAQEAAQMKAADDATVAVVEWIDDFSRDPRFSGVVDPERLKVHYGHALHAGTAKISKSSVEQFFVDEAEAINRATGGSKAQDDKLAAMQAQLDALKTNRQTDHVVQREASPNLAPQGGKSRSPAPTPQPKVRHVLAADRQAAIAAWKRGE